jgi:adenine-specific DNA-methyltransferase
MPPKPKASKSQSQKSIETFTHDEAKRTNIPTAEHQSVMKMEDKTPIQVAYDRRSQNKDPQLVWRGKDAYNYTDLVVSAPPLYIQEKIHPKVLLENLIRESSQREAEKVESQQLGLFADFNGFPKDARATDFYQHQGNWTNRMILGDSLQVMASLSEREGLRGKVQCIYLDPPYGIKFNSNFQWSTTSRDVKDGNVEHITREPEQVKAFRDTWRDGIHSYLTYLRDRLTVAKELLTESGSIFVQIGDENVHRVRALMDEVFGEENFVSEIFYRRGGFQTGKYIANTFDYVLWYSRSIDSLKTRTLYGHYNKEEWYKNSDKWKEDIYGTRSIYEGTLNPNEKLHSDRSCFSASGGDSSRFKVQLQGVYFTPPLSRGWSTSLDGSLRLLRSNRLFQKGKNIRFKPYFDDFPFSSLTNLWSDTVRGGFSSNQADEKNYVVQTLSKVIERCMLMTTDPGDLVLDPTCGSGTTAYVAEQWGRRWITIDTSRVALALARARIMGAKYPYYLLLDSAAGQQKEAQISQTLPSQSNTYGDIRQGFVYERVPHITLKAIANNADIDTIWEKYQTKLEPLRAALNTATGKKWEEWEIPREPEINWPEKTQKLHQQWWQQRIARQKEIDASISAKADQEYLYDKPYENKNIVRVAGPFTVESLSPHRTLIVDEDDNLIDPNQPKPSKPHPDNAQFDQIILENLKTAGVQQAHKENKIDLLSLEPWPGNYICAEGRYLEENSNQEKKAGIFIGPEFGTVSRADLVAVAREAAEIGCEVAIACAFNYDAYTTEFDKLGRIPILKARMNADLHMADDLKNTGKGNLFVVFGEPDIEMIKLDGDRLQIKIHGVDVFHPKSGEVQSSGADGIACWFIDSNYNEESFFVRHAYFLGANDPYKSLKTTLKTEINQEAWETLHSDLSRPFSKPETGRIAVKVINHLGDEVMKVIKIP